MQSAGIPDADLVIRSGGERRLSNFLLWQAAYAELVFTDKLWPDFGAADLEAALAEFARRDRRFGGVSVEASTAGTPLRSLSADLFSQPADKE
jgi:undecaprenyl diphosphate synthase